MAEDTKRTPKSAVEGEMMKSRTEESLDVLVGQLENALPQQFSDKHIDKYFDNQQKLFKYIREDHRDEKELTKHGRRMTVWYLIIGGAVLIIFMLIIALFDEKLLEEFLKLFFAFIGGTGVGSILTAKFGKKDG